MPQLTVGQIRLLCAYGTHSYQVRVRGYYAAYPFFGQPHSYQTGYLFDHQVPTPIDTDTASAGILVIGPNAGSGPTLPDAGWVTLAGNWNCSTFRLTVMATGVAPAG